jgi:hypothetical protein
MNWCVDEGGSLTLIIMGGMMMLIIFFGVLCIGVIVIVAVTKIAIY